MMMALMGGFHYGIFRRITNKNEVLPGGCSVGMIYRCNRCNSRGGQFDARPIGLLGIVEAGFDLASP